MRRISSKMTFFYKRIFPFAWFGFLLVFAAIATLSSGATNPSLPLFLIGPAAMTIVGYFIMKKLVFDLVDEVIDAGDALLIKNGTQQEHIALSDITNVNYSPLVNPPRVTLSLRRPSSFGDKVTFCAPVRFIPFTTSPIIDDLIERIDAARQRRPPSRSI
jgi:hypothetical protein